MIFTLIEMMMVLAISAILLSIAVTSYNSMMIKSKRSLAIAISALTEIAQLQERLYLTDRTYGVLSEFAKFEDADTVGIDSHGHVVAAGTGLCDVTMTVASASAFTIRATAKNTQASDVGCLAMSLAHNSVRSPASCG